jgi:hypothetical protein
VADAFARELLAKFGGRFGHREHLHMAWSYLRRDGLPVAVDNAAVFIRHVAESHGETAKYHDTLTRFWVHVVAVADDRYGATHFDDLLAAAPHLTDKQLPYRHWSRPVLESQAARTGWVEPDLVPLPAADARGRQPLR